MPRYIMKDPAIHFKDQKLIRNFTQESVPVQTIL
jgi:hypothetical protein